MWFVVFKSTWMRDLRMMTRYVFNTISSLTTMYIIFTLLFFGAKSIGAGAMNLGDTLESMFAGYVAWMLALMGCTDLAWGVSNEAQTGTLEQLSLSPLGYRWVALSSLSFNFSFQVLFISVLVALMSLTTGQRIHLDLVSIVPVVACIYAQAVGLGLVLAGLALIFKRIQSFFQIVQFLLIGIFLIPWSRYPWAKFLPLAMGRHILQEVLMRGLRLGQVGGGNLMVLGLVTAACVAVGAACFSAAEMKAKEKGLLGQY